MRAIFIESHNVATTENARMLMVDTWKPEKPYITFIWSDRATNRFRYRKFFLAARTEVEKYFRVAEAMNDDHMV